MKKEKTKDLHLVVKEKTHKTLGRVSINENKTMSGIVDELTEKGIANGKIKK